MEEMTESYDYVAILGVDDYFRETFAVLFEDSDSIVEGAVFEIDKERKLLVECK